MGRFASFLADAVALARLVMEVRAIWGAGSAPSRPPESDRAPEGGGPDLTVPPAVAARPAPAAPAADGTRVSSVVRRLD